MDLEACGSRASHQVAERIERRRLLGEQGRTRIGPAAVERVTAATHLHEHRREAMPACVVDDLRHLGGGRHPAARHPEPTHLLGAGRRARLTGTGTTQRQQHGCEGEPQQLAA